MPDIEGQEKTEQATPKKLEEGRKKGQVAKSIEINSFAVFSAGLILLLAFKNFIGNNITTFSRYIFNSLNELTISKDLVQLYAVKGVLFLFSCISPVLIGIVAFALISNIGQVGFKISFKALKPEIEKLNLIKGFKKVFFSSRTFVEVLKTIFKFTIVGLFTYFVVKKYVIESPTLIDYSIPQIVNYMLDGSTSLIIKLSIIFAVIAGSDFVFQKYKFKKDMMMTKQEVKEEQRQAEGDPIVRGKIKSKMLSVAKMRMMQEVPKADVVITNPTHYAVALKYDSMKNAAPKVVAKGVDDVAQKIKEIATKHNVPLHEDKELARSLFRLCDVGDEIPEKLFHAVAKVLAYIYSQKGKIKRHRKIV
ncbi:flagellar biosynthesis protein FlhB [Melioribacteraceae bacterium 4301-Me]|uniref:flagellar biosynthesis protein FlhB n=1 Tax=Pyranulibacter aquaticus TaxID=3163344 RepID=UPI0035986D95